MNFQGTIPFKQIVWNDEYNKNYNKVIYKISKDEEDYLHLYMARDCIYMNSLKMRSNLDRVWAMKMNLNHSPNESPLTTLIKQKFATKLHEKGLDYVSASQNIQVWD